MENKNKVSTQKRKQPKTIEELRLWYEWHNLPPEEVTRFFIGKNITEPKAFGIYKNERGECVVYKNKANGERAVRYQGGDEAFAVGELLQRLREEIANQKAKKPFNTVVQSSNHRLQAQSLEASPTMKQSLEASPTTAMRPSKKETRRYAAPKKPASGNSKWENGIFTVVAGMMVAIVMLFSGNHAPNGYYYYQGKHYYRQGSSWYLYKNTTHDWYQTQSLESKITKDNAGQYRISHFDGKRFEDTRWYDDGSYDSGDDDEWSDNDSWDSRDTDWDSDW